MTESAYDLFQQGQRHLKKGMPAQATVALEKQGKDAEANGHYKLASSLRPQNEHYASRILDLDKSRRAESD